MSKSSKVGNEQGIEQSRHPASQPPLSEIQNSTILTTKQPSSGRHNVRLIIATIQPTKLDSVRKTLEQIGVESMTVCDSRGYARQRGKNPMFRGHEYKANLLRKVTLEIAVHSDRLERVLETLSSSARTGPDGTIGDGKVFVLPLDDVIRLSDGVCGPEAV